MAAHFILARKVVEIFLLLMAATVLCAVGCMVNIADSPVPPIGADAFSGQSNGVKLWADPYADKARIIAYFGDDLLEYGVLPIFVRVQNESNRTILLDARAFSLSTYQVESERQTHAATAEARILSAQLQGAIAEDLGAIFLGPILGTLVKPGPVTQYQRNMNAIRINMRKKALKEQTLFVNSSISGFVYLTFSDVRSVANSPTLTMHILSTRGEMLAQINVGMPISARDLARPDR